MIRRVFTFPDQSQVLVCTERGEDGIYQTLATRPHANATWGPPLRPTLADDDPNGLG